VIGSQRVADIHAGVVVGYGEPLVTQHVHQRSQSLPRVALS
jgi:hypothetical protein